MLSDMEFQIVSDLHLETPLIAPIYKSLDLPVHADNLLLLGDIGKLKDDGLYTFLSRLLQRNPTVKVYYLLGNHEAYQISMREAKAKVTSLESKLQRLYGLRFRLLDRTRVDISPSITLLGCTLWTHVPSEEAAEVAYLLTDFNAERGIQGRTIDDHNLDHHDDVSWLNEQVASIEREQSHRQVIVATHHSPTRDPRANDAKHAGSSVNSGFSTDLANSSCWTSPAVKVWVFGHTHYNCAYRDEKTGKIVLANQKGYTSLRAANSAPLPTAIVQASASQDWFLEVEVKQESSGLEIRQSATDGEAHIVLPSGSGRLRKLFQRLKMHSNPAE